MARGTPAAGFPVSAPSSASWRPQRLVAPSPSWATVFTFTGSGAGIPRSSAACGRVSGTEAEARPAGREDTPEQRSGREYLRHCRRDRGARAGRTTGSTPASGRASQPAVAVFSQKEEPSSKRLRSGECSCGIQ
ncbi:uncharacterized protein TOMM20L [Callithrix jacchus]|uniref:uncharacterized protein TOMM20L isoform X2 n=1 Tax=Callithrix jacchus TaxID=9483 RepID=UPI00083FD261|nr:uncharacterized protein TOMM20L isoform X2 [Callithrix jacchus]